MTAAKPPLTALCNSRAPPAALGRQESVRRVVVRKSVARTHAVWRGPVPTRLDLHNRRAGPHKDRSRNRGTPAGPIRHPLKAPRRLLRERELSSLHSPLCCVDALRPGGSTSIAMIGSKKLPPELPPDGLEQVGIWGGWRSLMIAANRNEISTNGTARDKRVRYLSDLQSAPFAARDTPPQPWCGNNTRAGAIWLDRRV